ncbi:MAG: Trm112 family protein [Planctomycetes bacterium]|nr:Trm112 family protein [Planctomycetota bacterium]
MPDDSQPRPGADTAAPAPLDPSFLAILRCPESRQPLEVHGEELWCRESHRAYPIRDGIPVLLIEEARELSAEELAR